MATPKISTVIHDLSTLANNLPTVCAGATYTILGVDYTAAEAAGLIADLVAADDAVTQTKAAHTGAVAKRDALLAERLPIIAHLRTILVSQHGTSSTTLAALGLPPPKKRRQLTSEEKAVKAEKMRSTRQARGTKSKKQKSTIKGEVTGVTITPTREGDD
jgi:hypothetical protein